MISDCFPWYTLGFKASAGGHHAEFLDGVPCGCMLVTMVIRREMLIFEIQGADNRSALVDVPRDSLNDR